MTRACRRRKSLAQVELVDVLLCDELLDFEGMLAMDRNGFEFLGIELDILALAHLIALDDVVLRHFIAGFSIDLAIPDSIAGHLVELMEADLFRVPTWLGTAQSDMKRETASDSLSNTDGQGPRLSPTQQGKWFNRVHFDYPPYS